MRAGKLIESVAFDSPVETPDGQGGVEEGWLQEYCCRANFRNLRGGETVLQSRLEGTQPVVVTIRSSKCARAIKTDWRMRDTRNDEEYNVRSVVLSDSRQYIELTCERGVTV